MVSFELYPWHSPRITARLGGEDAREFIHEYIWKPVKELRAPVFAFGAGWSPILENGPGGRRKLDRRRRGLRVRQDGAGAAYPVPAEPGDRGRT